jgi:NAD(P)-dependent dehydrogenase (short-subunit alcohol dehydrogenase family)
MSVSLFCAVLVALIAAIVLIVQRLPTGIQRMESDDASFAGKHAVVVGGTAGIGEGIAIRLARGNCHVTIVGRNANRGKEVVARLMTVSQHRNVTHRFVQLDASLIGASKRFAREFVGPTDFLVLTQGVATLDGFTPTSERIDRKLALHYFSRAALALEFAPRLARSSDGRVLSVLSAGVHSDFADFATDFDLSKDFSLRKAANAAGFYNDILAEKLHAEFPSLTVVHAAPGFVASSWGSDLPAYLRWPTRFFQLFATTIETCGELLAPVFARQAPFAGKWHLVDRKSAPVPKTPLHDAAKDVVWAKTKALLATIPPSSD